MPVLICNAFSGWKNFDICDCIYFKKRLKIELYRGCFEKMGKVKKMDD